jgi:hypothetical protein
MKEPKKHRRRSHRSLARERALMKRCAFGDAPPLFIVGDRILSPVVWQLSHIGARTQGLPAPTIAPERQRRDDPPKEMIATKRARRSRERAVDEVADMWSLASFRSAALLAGLLACSGIASAAAPGPLDEAQRAGMSENRSQYFGTDAFNAINDLSDDAKAFGKEPALSDEDKRALMANLKTL